MSTAHPEPTQLLRAFAQRVLLVGGLGLGTGLWEEATGGATPGLPRATPGAVRRFFRRAAARTAVNPTAEVLRSRAFQQQAVADLGLRALTGASQSALMEHAVDVVAHTLGIESCSVLEALPGGDTLVVRAAWGLGPEGEAHATVPGEVGSQAGYTLLVGEPVVVTDARRETRFVVPRPLLDYGVVSRASVVIHGRVRPFGVLSAQTTRRRVFTREEIDFLQTIANTLAMAIEREAADHDRAEVLSRERLARAAAENLADVGRLINQSLDMEDVARRTAESVLNLLAADGASVLSLDVDSGDLRTLAVAGSAPPGRPGDVAFRRGRGLSALAVSRREPVWSRDVSVDPRLIHERGERERLRQVAVRSELAVPLIVRDDVVGVLVVGARERDFDDEQIRLARAFGDQVAVAMRNARLHNDLRLRLTATETLLAVSEDLAAVPDITEMMRRVARQIGRAVGADMVGAFLADAEERYLRPIAGYHVPKHLLNVFLSNAISLKGHPGLEQAWARRAPVWSPNVGADHLIRPEVLERIPHRSQLFCPMIVRDKPVGGLFVTWWEEAHEFTRDEIELVEGISRQAGVALAHAQLVEELKTHQGRLEALLEASRELARIQPQTELLTKMAGACAELVGADSVSVRLVAGDDLVLVGAWGDQDLAGRLRPRLKIGESVSGHTAAMGETVLVTDPTTNSWLIPEHRALGYRAWLSVPIKVADRVVGVLGLRTKRRHGFPQEAVAIAEAFAAQAAVALENTRLYREVEDARNRMHLLSRRVVDAQESERQHIARELHDEIGQVLTGLKFALEANPDSGSADTVRTNLEEADRLVHSLIERIRGMSLDLHPTMLDDLGLVPTLLSHLERYTTLTKVHVTFEHEGLAQRRCSAAVEATVYRIVQEALTNVARHAGVPEATVRLWIARDSLYAQIQDVGIGFDLERVLASERCSGLIGMQERAALVGGRVSLESAPGAGCWVTAELPMTVPGASDARPCPS